jgi:hypothetical protein
MTYCGTANIAKWPISSKPSKVNYYWRLSGRECGDIPNFDVAETALRTMQNDLNNHISFDKEHIKSIDVNFSVDKKNSGTKETASEAQNLSSKLEYISLRFVSLVTNFAEYGTSDPYINMLCDINPDFKKKYELSKRNNSTTFRKRSSRTEPKIGVFLIQKDQAYLSRFGNLLDKKLTDDDIKYIITAATPLRKYFPETVPISLNDFQRQYFPDRKTFDSIMETLPQVRTISAKSYRDLWDVGYSLQHMLTVGGVYSIDQFVEKFGPIKRKTYLDILKAAAATEL